jgi:rhomboid protease GluP
MRVLHRSLRLHESEERALVLKAMGIEHELERGVVGWRIIVPHHEETRALDQWRLYDIENQHRRPPAGLYEPGRAAGAVASAMVWALLLVAMYFLQVRHGFGLDWVGAGRVDVAAIRVGEWWRAITALTLHVDAPHLIGNIGFGAVFGILLAREIGSGLAWLLILAGGAAGNLMNVVVQRPSHTAIGASTAVFAALGLLAAYLWTGRRLIRNTWARRLAPVVGGIIMLAWFGTGGERTDIVAHLTGFLAGFGFGAVLGRTLAPGGPGAVAQWLFGGLSLCVVGLAWALAL